MTTYAPTNKNTQERKKWRGRKEEREVGRNERRKLNTINCKLNIFSHCLTCLWISWVMACLLALGWESWFLNPPIKGTEERISSILQEISVPRSAGRALWTEIQGLGGFCPAWGPEYVNSRTVAHANIALSHSMWHLTISDTFLRINIQTTAQLHSSHTLAK